MKAIVAVDKKWGIGKNGKLLVHLPKDLKYFREQTVGKIVVMGRKTLESLPEGKPLPDRQNIVLTRENISQKDIVSCRSITALKRTLSSFNTDDVFVIGGGLVYVQLLPYCNEALVTKIDKVFDAHTFFPNLDAKANWKLISESGVNTDNEINYTWCVYKKMNT